MNAMKQIRRKQGPVKSPTGREAGTLSAQSAAVDSQFETGRRIDGETRRRSALPVSLSPRTDEIDDHDPLDARLAMQMGDAMMAEIRAGERRAA